MQDGQHSQLINTDGEYKNIYESQRKWYVVVIEGGDSACNSIAGTRR